MLIGLDGDVTLFDIELIMSKVKVIKITFAKKWFPLIILRTIIYLYTFVCPYFNNDAIRLPQRLLFCY